MLIRLQLWRLYLSLPSSLANEFADQRKKQKEYLAVRHDLNATSSQDEFAKWAKLRRQHDKLLDELEKKSRKPSYHQSIPPLLANQSPLPAESGLEASRARFDRYLTAARLISTRGAQWFLPMWYGRVPMFWLPYGWFPYYVEWFASFPRAPLGSVSIVVWQGACTGMLALVIETAVGILGLVAAGKQQSQGPKQKQKQSVPAAGAGSAESKKEL